MTETSERRPRTLNRSRHPAVHRFGREILAALELAIRSGGPVDTYRFQPEALTPIARFEASHPGMLWRAYRYIHDGLMERPLDSEAIPRILRRMVPGLPDADLALLSEHLWLSWADEVAVREITRRVRGSAATAGSPFWQEVDRFLGDPTRNFWSGLPLLRMVRVYSEKIVPFDRRRKAKGAVDRLARHGDADALRTFLSVWRDLQRPRRLNESHVPMETPVERPVQKTIVIETTPVAPPVVTGPRASEAPADPLIGWVTKMNGGRYDFLLDRIHGIADAWRQDSCSREALLEPMAAVILNLEKYLRASGLRPRHPLGKHLTVTSNDLDEFNFQGEWVEGTSRQVVVSRTGWLWNGVPISRPTVVEASVNSPVTVSSPVESAVPVPVRPRFPSNPPQSVELSLPTGPYMPTDLIW